MGIVGLVVYGVVVAFARIISKLMGTAWGECCYGTKTLAIIHEERRSEGPKTNKEGL